MHTISFYPIGNADCCKIVLENNKILIFDFAHTIASEDENDKRIDLAKTIRDELEGVDTIDVLAFTHADNDHVCGSKEFFWFDYATTYHSDERIKFKELWVPAAFILETGLTGDAMVIQKEAKHRLENGYGVRVYSKPKMLEKWLSDRDIKLKDRLDMIHNAGTLIPCFNLDNDGVEFFIHSPFSQHSDDEEIGRNEKSLIFNLLFKSGDTQKQMMLIGDTEAEVLSEIVDISKAHDNEERLKWDIYDIPHHCSHNAINSEKGKTKTEPIENVAWLMEQGNNEGILVSCSDVIPDTDTTQPPHKQAAEYYKEIAKNINGQFIVTMSYPKKDKPDKYVINIGEQQAVVKCTQEHQIDIFHVPYRQPPLWPVIRDIPVIISANISGPVLNGRYTSDMVVPKAHEHIITFKAICSIPYYSSVYWQVVNTGDEARDKRDLRGDLFQGEMQHQETTKYRGTHYIQCFIVKGRQCYASREFIVRIG